MTRGLLCRTPLASPLLLVCALALALASAGTAQPPPATAERELAAMALDLREAKGLAGGIADAALRARLEAMIELIEQRRAAVERQLASRTAPVPAPVFTEGELARLLESLAKAAFDARRRPLLEGAIAHRRVTAAQGVRLVRAFSFSEGRIEAAVLVHARLADPASFFQVLDALTFDSERDTVRQRLGLPR